MELGALFSTSLGTLVGPRVGPDCSFAQWTAEAQKTVATVERAGFRYLVVTHSYDNTWMHPYVMLTHIAPMSGRLRMSTEVLQLPLLNPMDMAYALSAIDNVSGGRLDVGVGIGYHAKELRGAGIDRTDRVPKFEEGIEVLKKFWTGTPVQHDGRYFKGDGVTLTLRPVQRPHPPIWGSAQSLPAAQRAGRMLDGIVVAPQVAFEDLKALLDAYRSEWAQHHAEAPGRVAAWRTLIVGADPTDALRQAMARGELKFKRYQEGAMQEKSMVNIRLELREDDAADWAILGNNADLLEGLRRCRDEFGLTRVSCHFYNIPDEAAARRDWLQRFGEEVIARL